MLKPVKKLLNIIFAPSRLVLKSAKKAISTSLVIRPKLYFGINLLIILLVIVVLCLIVQPLPKVKSTTPPQNGTWDNPEDYLEVEFTRPIDTDKVELHLAPEMKGEWKEVKVHKELPFVTKMRFYPEETVMPGEECIIYIVGYNPKKIGETMIEFNSAALPEVKEVNISNEELRNQFPLDGDIEFTMSNPIGDFTKWRAEISPVISFEIQEDRENNKVIIIPQNRLALNTQYSIKLYRDIVTYNIKDKSTIEKNSGVEAVYESIITTDSSPVISSTSPSGGLVLVDTPIEIVLGRIVDRKAFENKFKIEPEVKGTFTWIDDLNVQFTPDQPLEKATNYKVKIEKGFEYANGIKTKEDIVFDFETIGYVTVTAFNIASGSKNMSVGSNIVTQFNQPVDKESAQASFQISPSIDGTFSWSGEAMTFNPNSYLGYSTNYTITIKSGVKTINGLDSKEEYTTSFTTAPNIFKISVPYYKQVQRFECELLALRMALAYRGIYMSANQIMYEIGISSVPYNSTDNTWGDPNVYFVGDVTGASKGYGVHLDPLARVARTHGRGATVNRGWTASGIAQEVQNGNPVIILWQNGWSAATNISWHTLEGKYIYAINGTHAGVVVGFKGPAENPEAMIVQDPWYRGGSQRTYSISSFNSLWSIHGKSALVIY